MAKIKPKTVFVGFDLEKPDLDELIAVDAQGKVEVRVKDTGGNDRYAAQITNIGATVVYDNRDLKQQGSTNIYSASLYVGPVPNTPPAKGHDNKTVAVQAFQGSTATDSGSNDFRAWSGGSGSGTFLTAAAAGVAAACPNCGTNQPVPVALQLRLDARVTAGTWAAYDHLNQPTLLLHSNDPVQKCSWFCSPLDAPGGGPAFWQLQKDDPHTWILRLRRGHADVVTYRHRSVTAKDCSFPITLHLASPERGDHEHWPRTVTITPAP